MDIAYGGTISQFRTCYNSNKAFFEGDHYTVGYIGGNTIGDATFQAAVIAATWAVGKAISKAISSLKVSDLTKKASAWLGKDTKTITNKAGDKVFLSKDGIRRIRFDIKNPGSHKYPHAHVEELVNGKWKGVNRSKQIYPKK